MYRTSLIISFLTLLVVACSSNYKRPESIAAKMKRLTPRPDSSGVIPTIGVNKQWKQSRSRMPASVKNGPREYQALTNKKVYFLTLLHQYNHLRPLSLVNAPKITTCPHFHGTVISYNNKFSTPSSNGGITTKWKINGDKLKDESYLANHPELFLSTVADNKHPTLGESISQMKNKTSKLASKHLVAAIQTHTNTNYNELKELCQTGSSDNYYAFENLVNFTQTERTMKPVVKDLNSLLKTSIFANHAVLSSLSRFSSKRSPASKTKGSWHYINPLMNEVTLRIKVPWALDYFNQLKQN